MTNKKILDSRAIYTKYLESYLNDIYYTVNYLNIKNTKNY